MASDPEIITIPSETWTVVATNVTTGTVHIVTRGPAYRHTYRLAGTAAPTLATEGVLIKDDELAISNTVAIDVYVYANIAGTVRADL